MLFCGMSAVCWWFLQAVDLLLQITLGAGKWTGKKKFNQYVVYNAWAWGFPFIITVICAGVDRLGNQSNGIPYCFITSSNLSWGIFYAPIALMCVIGAGCMITILTIIFRSSRDSGAHKKKGGYLIYVRPLLFITVFLFVWAFVFAYRFSEYFNEDTYTADTTSWITCVLSTRPASLLANALNPLSPVVGCTVRPNSNKGLYYMIQLVISGVGIWGFLLYNTSENMIMWYHLLTCKHYNFSRTSGGQDETGDSQSNKSQGNLSKQPSKRNVRQGQSTQNLVKGSTTGSYTDDEGLAAAGGAGTGAGGLKYGIASPSAVQMEDAAKYSSASVPPTGVAYPDVPTSQQAGNADNSY